jgi:hypothetical protein
MSSTVTVIATTSPLTRSCMQLIVLQLLLLLLLLLYIHTQTHIHTMQAPLEAVGKRIRQG